MKKVLTLFLLMTILSIAACSNDTGNNVDGESSKQPMESTTISDSVEPFEAINQDENEVSLHDFEGQWWVANFVFTNCTTVCPPMTRNMKILQDGLEEAGLDDVQLVSFSVDPERDTTDVLKEYGENHGANFDTWNFLTGYDFDTVKNISETSFKSSLLPPGDGDDQVMHTISFFLINPDGEVVDRFDGTKQDDMDLLVERVNDLK
ncbi:SCO family protein [Pseudogracilibacillus sp. ICA-222130]|uniref:SCO family protein n=1 Tax=Pseudogracilibacillus sp. ICA-222130 TaxID=3134655 RepID=UPI0030C5DC03